MCIVIHVNMDVSEADFIGDFPRLVTIIFRFKCELERCSRNIHWCFLCLWKEIKNSGENLTNWSIISFVCSIVSAGMSVAAGQTFIFSAFSQKALGDSWVRSGGWWRMSSWLEQLVRLSCFLSFLRVRLSSEDSQLWPAASLQLEATATAQSDSTPQIFSHSAISSVSPSIRKCFLSPLPH